MPFSHWRQHPFSEWKSLKCNYLHNHDKIKLTWFKPYCSHCMSPFPISIPQSTRNTVFCFQKIFTVLSGRPIWSWFLRFMRPPHLCKTHAQTVVSKKWQRGKNDFSIQITRNSINNCLGMAGVHFSFVTRWLCISVTTRLCSNWTTQSLGVLRLDRTHGKLPLTSCSIWAGTRAVKGAVGLWKVFA